MSIIKIIYYTSMVFHLYYAYQTYFSNYHLLEGQHVPIPDGGNVTTPLPITTTMPPPPSSTPIVAPNTTDVPSSTPAPVPVPVPTPTPPAEARTQKELALIMVVVALGAYGVLRQDVVLVFIASILQFYVHLYLLGSLSGVHVVLWLFVWAQDEEKQDFRDELGIPENGRLYYTTNRGPLVRVWI